MSHFLPKIISGFNLYSSPNNTIIQSPYYFLSAIAAECYIPNHINLICMCCLYLWIKVINLLLFQLTVSYYFPHDTKVSKFI